MKEVTLKFYSANEKLPEKSGEYLVLDYIDRVTTLNFSSKHQKFNVFDRYTKKQVEKLEIEVKFWAELPNLKEEDEEDIVIVDKKKFKPLYDFLIGR